MPASETSATRLPCRQRRQRLGPRALGGVLVVALQLGREAVGGEQLAGHPGVLGQHQVGGGQHVERAQGDVAQVADRRRHHIEPRRQRRVVEGGRRTCGPWRRFRAGPKADGQGSPGSRLRRWASWPTRGAERQAASSAVSRSSTSRPAAVARRRLRVVGQQAQLDAGRRPSSGRSGRAPPLRPAARPPRCAGRSAAAPRRPRSGLRASRLDEARPRLARRGRCSRRAGLRRGWPGARRRQRDPAVRAGAGADIVLARASRRGCGASGPPRRGRGWRPRRPRSPRPPAPPGWSRRGPRPAPRRAERSAPRRTARSKAVPASMVSW